MKYKHLWTIAAAGAVLLTLTACSSGGSGDGIAPAPAYDDRAACKSLYQNDSPDGIDAVLEISSPKLSPYLLTFKAIQLKAVKTYDDNSTAAEAMNGIADYCTEIGAW
jgi:hypothetical protein